MRRKRQARIVATLGPASSDKTTIETLFAAGVDVFRLNFSHGSHEDHAERFKIIREIEHQTGRPIGVLMDLQGPKLRIGTLRDGKVQLQPGERFQLDLDESPGDDTRAPLPHPEIFAALVPGTELLIDDGRIRLRVEACNAHCAETVVMVGGTLSNRKGVNVPGVVLPISPLTEKDLADLAFGLELGVDWVALSFVQRAQDVAEARKLVGDRAWIMAKLEKPAAIDQLDDIVAEADGIMVARGDLGVELPPQQVPVLQRRIIRAARRAGKPVVVATQMLESMVAAPIPTRAEASDVATAIYVGADAVMLSAESASGSYPVEAVTIMDQIICEVEADPAWRNSLDASYTPAEANTPDAICQALRDVTSLMAPVATVTFTASGFSTLRAARERPLAPIMGLTPQPATARRLSLVWGVHPVPYEEIHDVNEMISHAGKAAVEAGFAHNGDLIIVIAGIPFGRSGTTNLLHIARIG